MTFLLVPITLIFGAAAIGTGLVAAKILMICFSLGTLIVVYLLGLKIFKSKWAAGLAVLLLAIYPPFIMLSLLTLTEMPFTFLMLLLIYRFLIFTEKDNYRQLTILLIIFWIALMIRPTIMFLPFALLPLYLTKKTNWKELFKKVGFAAIFLVVLMMPWWYRNYVVFGKFIPLSTGSSNPLTIGSYDINDPAKGPLNFAYYKLDRSNLLEKFTTPDNKAKLSTLVIGDPQIIGFDAFYAQLYEKGKYLGYYFMTPKEAVAFEEADGKLGKTRMEQLLKSNPREFTNYYLIRKPKYLWKSGYYPITIAAIPVKFFEIGHRLILLAFLLSVPVLFFTNKKLLLTITLILGYFTALYAYYFSFARYNFPLMPILILVGSYGTVVLAKKFSYLLKR
jgi:4-amino-4-deoxy-L-arabinose transferase-like glycosyltransferase